MTAPRLIIDCNKIYQNALTLVQRLAERGVAVTAVTKAALGSVEIAGQWLRAGVCGLGDSRIENIEAMQSAGIRAGMTLIRSPMLSQVDRVVARAAMSLNTEMSVIRALSSSALRTGQLHGVVLMVELGDLREGIMPDDLEQMVRDTLCLPNIALRGIGANLACQSGVVPDATNMAELSTLADSIEEKFDIELDIVSGGNSASLDWVLGNKHTGRINHLRLGESLLLGREPQQRQALDGLHTDAFTLVGEVIESKVKPSQPWGEIGQTAFGEKPRAIDRGLISQAIVALGHQDTDPSGLEAPAGITILGASSDHLVLDAGHCDLAVGAEVAFLPNYSALVRAMTTPFVEKVFLTN